MPCRALEAFRPSRWRAYSRPPESVLMPCRALEAFRPAAAGPGRRRAGGLNALSGIGGVQTFAV